MSQVDPWDVHDVAKDDEEAGLVSVHISIRRLNTVADNP